MERREHGRERGRQPDANPRNSYLVTGALGAVAATGLAAAYYYFNKSSNTETPTVQIQERAETSRNLTQPRRQQSPTGRNVSLQSVLQRFLAMGSYPSSEDSNIIPRSSVPDRPCITNTNSLLSDIYKRFVALKKEDCDHYYKVFEEVFRYMQVAMNEVDPYYKRYSSKKQFAGSHLDHVRIVKPSEYDMDIAIRLPLNFDIDPINPEQSDLIIEPKGAGFVQLKTGAQFKNIYKRDGIDVLINKTACEWADEKGYLLGSKFISWFKSVVDRALNTFPLSCTGGQRVVYVEGETYHVKLSSSGPAITVCIKGPRSFSLDVDFVPALRFPETRWPDIKQYRPIPAHCKTGEFMVVPKKNPAGSEVDKERSWRLAMQDQEKKLMYNKVHMKQVIRLMKKFRDSNQMKGISSYYIKTLFFWEIDRQLNAFWSDNDVAFLFRFMMGKLKEAVVNGHIPYYWNDKNNLINCGPETLGLYSRAIEKVLAVMDDGPQFKDIAKFMLDSNEFQAYKSILY